MRTTRNALPGGARLAALGCFYWDRHQGQAGRQMMLQVAEGSTVIDMTGPEPLLVRLGKGDPSLFVEEEPAYA
jgi:hypothetical protein